MTYYYKIFLTILISLFLLPTTGSAAELSSAKSLEITLLQENSVADKELTIILPDNLVKNWSNKSNRFPRSLLFKSPPSFSDYLTETFDSSALAQTNKPYFELVDFLKSQILPNLKYSGSKDAVWEENNGRVVKFEADSWGRSYDIPDILRQIREHLLNNQNQFVINAITFAPQIKLSEINPYGITGLVAAGESDFTGSSNNRVKNITVGISRFRGMLVTPNDTFSFNDILGPVDGEHGFAPELVIKHNGIFPEFGGGLCQVSTTVFRAALNGGLPITERRNHSFAVQYYAPQGTDATIYPGAQDLKFVNDTKSNILIWPEINGTILTFNFYGAPDDRKVQVEQPIKYDIKTTGAFKTNLKRTVTYADGKLKEDVFTSSYRPKEEFTQTTTAQEPAQNPPPQSPTPPTIPEPQNPPENTPNENVTTG